MKNSVTLSVISSLLFFILLIAGLYYANFSIGKSSVSLILGISVVGLLLWNKLNSFFEVNFIKHCAFSFVFIVLIAFSYFFYILRISN